jgi:hypothetical protein
MTKIDTETRLDFDRSVSTESRFAMRKWLEELVKAMNYNDRSLYLNKLSSSIIVEGFNEQSMDHSMYIEFLEKRAKQPVARVMRFPELQTRYEGRAYYISGRYEEFLNGILSLEGNIDLEVVTEEIEGEGDFKLALIKFYPRLKVSYPETVLVIKSEMKDAPVDPNV